MNWFWRQVMKRAPDSVYQTMAEGALKGAAEIAFQKRSEASKLGHRRRKARLAREALAKAGYEREWKADE